MISETRVIFGFGCLIFVLLLSHPLSASAEQFNLLSVQERQRMGLLSEPTAHWQKSKWWLDGYFSSAGRAKLQANKDRPINLLMAPPNCPTTWRWYYGSGNAQNKWEAEIRQSLKGYPQEVVEYCAKPLMPIKSGFLTQHPINSKYVQRGVATVIIRDLKSDKVAVLRAIQENDYTSNKTGGAIYNEFLTEVCEFKFLATSNALINCRHYGAFGAEFEITNLFKGEYKLFGKNEDYAFFITNLSLNATKSKYKGLISSKADKPKCAFNCK